jgi:putative beta barrel porin BBP7
MKIHLPWIRVTAAAVLVAGVGVHEAAAQYAPYRPIPQQAPAPAVAPPVVAAPQQAPATQQPMYTAYRTQPAAPTQGYGAPQPTPAYGSPTGAQYTQPTAAYPQTAGQYPQTPAQQYPTNYSAYPYVAQQPTPESMPAPKNTSAAQPSSNSMMAAPAASMPTSGMNMSAAQPGGCGCSAGSYGAGDYYTAPGCGCGATGGYPNCNMSNYMGDTGCSDNQWFGGVYFLEMGRTNASPVKLTSQMPPATGYPYYPQPADTIMTTRDVNFDFREGVEIRVGSTFTIGEPQCACQSSCGYNTSCGGCNSCAPVTTYAWEVAWWGLNDNPNDQMVEFDGTNRIYGMKSYAGLMYDHGSGDRSVNDYYDYQMPIEDPAGATPAAGTNGYIRVVSQRIRTDFRAQNLELNVIRFPVCATSCQSNSCGCNNGCGGCDGGCDDNCGLGFSMYGSCGVRYFHVADDLLYGTDFQEFGGGAYGATTTLNNNVEVKNNLVGPQVGWTSDYCWHKWNLFCNSTFGIFDNHQSVWQWMRDDTGNYATYQNGSNMNVRSNKDSVAFLGELRLGAAYDITCHWRGVVAYRALALTGVATASDQLSNLNTDQATTGIIQSDNSMIIHGVQVGAECRY